MRYILLVVTSCLSLNPVHAAYGPLPRPESAQLQATYSVVTCDKALKRVTSLVESQRKKVLRSLANPPMNIEVATDGDILTSFTPQPDPVLLNLVREATTFAEYANVLEQAHRPAEAQVFWDYETQANALINKLCGPA